MTRSLLLVFLLIAVMACTPKSDQTPEKLISADSESDSIPDSTIQAPNGFPPPLVFTKLYDIDHLDWTASVGAADGRFCDSTSTGFYGIYNLLDMTPEQPNHLRHAGTITVYKERNGITWGAGDTTQQFRHLQITSAILPVWDSIRVGTSRSELIQFLGGHPYKQSGNTIAVTLGRYRSLFTLSDTTIAEIEITRNCLDSKP